MEGLRRHFTYANVVATLALIVAVAGGTTAIAGKKKSGTPVRATANSDVSKKAAIRPGHVTAAKLAGGAVSTANLAEGSVGAAKLGPIDVVRVSGTTSATATCPSGQRLLAGGVGSSGPVTSSLPDLPPGGAGNGWHVIAEIGSSVQAYALCLH